MAKEDHSAEKKMAPPFFIPMNVFEMNKTWLDPLLETQTLLLNELQQMNQKWTSHVSSEAELTSEYLSKLAAARSLPDVASASQDWLQQHMQKFAEAGREFISYGQKLVQASTRAFPSGLPACRT